MARTNGGKHVANMSNIRSKARSKARTKARRCPSLVESIETRSRAIFHRVFSFPKGKISISLVPAGKGLRNPIEMFGGDRDSDRRMIEILAR